MKCVHIGVIGIGNIGSVHAKHIYEGKIEGATLAAICDIKEERISYAKDEYEGVSCYTNYSKMLQSKNIDAVIIAVPHKMHAKIAKEALQNNIHVLCEKPIDITISAALDLNEFAKKSRCKFAIMFNQRTNPLFQKVKEIVEKGLLGELKRSIWIVTNWYRTQQYYDSGEWRASWNGEGGGVLINQAPHNLDLWQWICGMPDEITAFCDVAKYHRIEVEDDVTIYARYGNGATGIFITTTGEYPGTNRLEISGTLGKVVLENAKLKWWSLDTDEREICACSKEGFPKIQCDYKEIECTEPETGHNGIIQNFVRSILYNEPLIAPGIEGIHELMISNAAYMSEWTGNIPVKLPFDSKEFDTYLEQRMLNKKEVSKEVKKVTDKHELRWAVHW